MQISQSENRPVIKAAVTLLSEAVYRQGGLSFENSSGSAAEGIRLHKIYYEALKNKAGKRNAISEYPLSIEFSQDNITLQLSGRCDIVVPDQEAKIIEIKTFNKPGSKLPTKGETSHWAQLNLYAYMYLVENPETDVIEIELVYLSVIDRQRKYWSEKADRKDLKLFYEKSCRSYLEITGQWLKWQDLRDKSIIDCRFPYPAPRSGQHEMMSEVLSTVKQSGILFAQAPTGTGKTMSVLFPSIKALGRRMTDHIFYLTAMTSTRQVAVQALQDLRECGLHIRNIVLYAKEKMCLVPDIYCDTAVCEYASRYYDNLPDALRTLLMIENISQDDILTCAKRFKVCPFELSLDISLYCDVIVCDYNYAFDPRVQLERFFGSQPRNCLLLVDEAHNLPDRSREMYSASVDDKLILDAIARLKKEQPDDAFQRKNTVKYLNAFLQNALSWFEKLKPGIMGDLSIPGFESAEVKCQPGNTMIAENFWGMRYLPEILISYLARTSYFIRKYLEEENDYADKSAWSKLNFEILFFIRISDLFGDGNHVTTLELTSTKEKLLSCRIMCIDAAKYITQAYYLKRPAVFFSATLSPLAYYIGLIDNMASENPPSTLMLSSPFPSENLLLMVFSGLSARFRDRDQTMPSMLGIILDSVRMRTGNYLVFVPSFSYLGKIRKLLKSAKPNDIDCQLQIPGMNDELKKQFISRFDTFGSKTLLAFAVLGSLFNEGIDLVGEKLSGVIIIGAGLPQLSPQREIIRQYFEEKIGSGYAYSYVFPGFNKVQQAAGRLIRSENDRGFVLLMDDRLEKFEYQQLFPAEWAVNICKDQSEIVQNIEIFWDS